MANRKSGTAAKNRGASKKSPTSRNRKRKNKSTIASKDWYIIHVVALVIISAVLSVLVYIDTGSGGVINTAVKSLLFGLFGWVGYLIPASFIGYLVYLILNRNIKRLWLKISQTTLALINISSIIALSARYDVPSDAMYDGATNMCGGGYIGALVGGGIENLFQIVLAYMILIVSLIWIISFVVSFPLFDYIKMGINSLSGQAQSKYTHRKPKVRPIGAVVEAQQQEIDDFDDFIEEEPEEEVQEEHPKKRRKRVGDKIAAEEAIGETPEIEEEFENGIADIFGDDEYSVDVDNVALVDKTTKRKGHTVPADSHEYSVDEPEMEEEQEPDEEVVSEPVRARRESRERVDKITAEEKKNYSEELDSAIQQEEPIEYVFPPTDLLALSSKTTGDQRMEMRQTAERLISVLATFGVKAKLLQVTQGPAVTRYEIQPDTGTKLAKITGLAEDIALNLAVSTVLVAPVPGKVAIGIEIPNNKVSSVTARELLESPEFKNSKSKLTVALGKDIGGNVVVGNIAKWPHVLIAGQTGSGKSVCINTIITSILYNASPEDVRMIMIDPKVVELGVYNGIPHLLIPVVTDPKKAAGALNWAVSEMMRRYDLFKNTGVRKLESYNALMEETGGKKEPQLVIIIDELADLMMVAAKEVEDYICRLAQLARAAGIHLIVATQRPSVDVITGLIKANVPSRIAFSVSSQVDSRTILDKGGAEKLLGMGDMLYYPTGARAAIRVQGAFVSDEEIERVIEFIKGNIGETHYSEDLAEQIERCASGENGVTPDVDEDGDPLLQDAIQLAIELGKISTSMVQRRLGVGYSRAGRLIDQMEARGIISGANGSKPRDVLVSHADMIGYSEDDADED